MSDQRPRARRPVERIVLRTFLYLLLASSVGTGINTIDRPKAFPDHHLAAMFAWLTAAVAASGLAITVRRQGVGPSGPDGH